MFAQKVDEKKNFKVVVGKEISSKVDNFPLNGQGKGRFLFPARKFEFGEFSHSLRLVSMGKRNFQFVQISPPRSEKRFKD